MKANWLHKIKSKILIEWAWLVRTRSMSYINQSIDLFIPDDAEVQYISTCVKGLVKIEIRVIPKEENQGGKI